MPPPSRRAGQLKKARAGLPSRGTTVSQPQTPEGDTTTISRAYDTTDAYGNHLHWECLDTDDDSDPEVPGSENDGLGAPALRPNAFDLLDGSNSTKRSKPYERGSECTDRHKRRKRQQAVQAAEEARRNSQSIVAMFMKKPPAPAVIPREPEEVSREWAIKGMEKKLREDRTLSQATFIRHQAVLTFMRLLLKRQPGETRMGLANMVARSYSKKAFARSIPAWEKAWIEERRVPESKQGHQILVERRRRTAGSAQAGVCHERRSV